MRGASGHSHSDLLPVSCANQKGLSPASDLPEIFLRSAQWRPRGGAWEWVQIPMCLGYPVILIDILAPIQPLGILFFFFNFFFPHPMAAASSSHALSKVKQSMCPDSPWGGLFTIWNSVSWLPVTSALWWVQENCDWFCTPLSISLLLGWEGRSRAALQILSRSGIPSVLQTAPPFTSQALRSGG